MKFLFCSLDTPGFLHPAAGIALELKARGHEVAFVADIKCSQFLANSGLRRIPRGVNDGSSFQVAQWAEPIPVAIQVKHIEHALACFSADVLVGQSLTFGPLLVAESYGLPVGLVGFCTYLWPNTNGPEGVQRSAETEARLRWRFNEMLWSFNQARRIFRLPPCESGCRENPLLGDLFLIRSVPQLEIDFDWLPERAHLVGSCLWEPAEAEPDTERWIAEAVSHNRPIIYVQHGRFFHMPSFWPLLARALPEAQYAVAASSGRLDCELGALPSGFLVRPHLAQSRILSKAQVLVASANSTAVLGALEAGIPMFLVPGGGEQPDVAEQVERAGVAKCLKPEEVTPKAIGNAIEILMTDPHYRQRASDLRAAFGAINGLERSADLIECLAITRKPVLRDRKGCQAAS